jgi:hypothetical protein
LVLLHFFELSHLGDFVDELEIVYESGYETKNAFIFAWSLILGVGHYRWLHGPIHRPLSNSKADYLICII